MSQALLWPQMMSILKLENPDGRTPFPFTILRKNFIFISHIITLILYHIAMKLLFFLSHNIDLVAAHSNIYNEINI